MSHPSASPLHILARGALLHSWRDNADIVHRGNIVAFLADASRPDEARGGTETKRQESNI